MQRRHLIVCYRNTCLSHKRYNYTNESLHVHMMFQFLYLFFVFSDEVIHCSYDFLRLLLNILLLLQSEYENAATRPRIMEWLVYSSRLTCCPFFFPFFFLQLTVIINNIWQALITNRCVSVHILLRTSAFSQHIGLGRLHDIESLCWEKVLYGYEMKVFEYGIIGIFTDRYTCT